MVYVIWADQQSLELNPVAGQRSPWQHQIRLMVYVTENSLGFKEQPWNQLLDIRLYWVNVKAALMR